MVPVAAPASLRVEGDRHINRSVFILLVFGVVLFCVGILLSVFAFHSCDPDQITNCYATLKIVGPALAVVGLGSIVLARSRVKLYLRQRQLEGHQVDPQSFFICGRSSQFAQLLIFGFLFLTSGVFITAVGFWVPGCSTAWQDQHINGTSSTDLQHASCGFLSLQILGPMVMILGICFFAVAEIKRQQALRESQESASITEDLHSQTSEPYRITVGETVILFPPPPPPYFTVSPSITSLHSSLSSSSNENPPPYHTICNHRSQLTEVQRTSFTEENAVYTITMPSTSPEGLPCLYNFSPDPPPSYEEKELSSTNQPSAPS